MVVLYYNNILYNSIIFEHDFEDNNTITHM